MTTDTKKLVKTLSGVAWLDGKMIEEAKLLSSLQLISADSATKESFYSKVLSAFSKFHQR